MKQLFNCKTGIIKTLTFKRTILLAVLVLFISVDGFARLRANFTVSSKTICDGSSVTFTNTSTGTSVATEYFWNFGAGASPATATGPGPHVVSYTIPGVSRVRLTLTEEGEDPDSQAEDITINAIPAAPEVSVTNNCNGTSTLSTLAGGTLLWSTDETNSTITVTASGTYTVTTTIDGCTSLPGSGTAEPKSTPATPVITVVNNCDGTSVLSTDATGALLWSTGATTPAITVTASGTYTVTTTVNACTSLQGSGTAAPGNTPATPVVTVVNNCDGTSTLSTVAAGTLLWSTSEATSSIIVTVAGTYTVTATVGGCTSLPGSGTAAPKTATAIAIPVVTVVNNCNGTSTLSTGATGTLLWSTGETNSIITVTASGTYTVTTTVDGCTSVPGSGTAAPKAAIATPVVTVVNNCNGTSTLSTEAPGALLWNTAATTSSIIVTVSGVYSVTATIDGCTSLPGSGTAALKTIPATPVVTVVDNCNGTSTLSTEAPGALLWNTAATTSTITAAFSGVYTVTTTVNGCTSLPGSGTAAPKTAPAAPIVAATLQPTCTFSTGSVQLNGLPAGTWTINPGNITGTTVSRTISGLTSGTYSFTVTNSAGCTSAGSSSVIIYTQPLIPAPPVAGTITQPSCNLSTGSLVLNGLIENGIWTLTRYPGTVILTGIGTSTTISGLPAGTYNFTLANAEGCVSVPSANILINAQPPSPPVPAQVTDCALGFDKAVVTVTSPLGQGLEYSIDGGAYSSSTVFVNQKNGNHIINVRNSSGCITSGVDFSISCGCANPPIITLSSISGSTCGTTAVTVGNNLISGSATKVTLSTNGGGTISPVSSSVSPFAFTYIPAQSDAGKKITISFITDNPLGSPCAAGTGIFTLTVNAIPTAPLPGVVTQATCKEPTGSFSLSGLPAAGEWIVTRNPGSLTVKGTGTSTLIAGLAAGTYSFTVTNLEGCISAASSNVVINSVPGSPGSPLIGLITPPTCNLATGSVSLSGLPLTGLWTLTRFPDNVTSTGSGASVTITGLSSGTYNYTVTNSVGCISELSQIVLIPVLSSTVSVIVTNPPSLCSPGKADLTNPSVTAGSTPGITYAYFRDAAASNPFTTPSAADNGIYYIRGTNSGGCYDIKPVVVTVVQAPVANAGPDKILNNQFETNMEAVNTQISDTGTWSVISGAGVFLDDNDAKTRVIRLSTNQNIFIWVVKNGVCPASSDTVRITVTGGELKIQTLITPNMDGRNDYFELPGLEEMGRTELVIFDRRGVQVFKNVDYDNLWNGVDYNGNPLHDDTYFYVLKTENGKTVNGFIVIRR